MIYIPTFKRWNKQPTAKALIEANIPFAYVIRPEEKEEARKTGQRFVVIDSPVSNLSQTRQWMLENLTCNYQIWLDDDLKFAVRGKRKDNPMYLSIAEPEDIKNMINEMYDHMHNGWATVGISAREGNNRKSEPTEQCARMMRAWGFDRSKFLAINGRFDQFVCMSDFDFILQFLTNGHANLILNNYTTNQDGSNTDGGCSVYRTKDVLAEAAEGMSKKYPGIVKVVEKETKGAWGGGFRKDVIIYWKKAFKK